MEIVTQHNAALNLSQHYMPTMGCHQGVGDRIYTEYFQLKGAPFSITPDPEFLFLSETHRNVIEKIQYGIRTRMGFMLLSGEVGTGKTTLCRLLLDHLHDNIRTVYVINPSLTGQELLAGILDDLGIVYPPAASKKELMDRLNCCLLNHEIASPVVIIVDDAQTMPLDTLEDLRLLSNLETDKAKLLQMLLVGQPELLANLNQPRMRQLKQRVAVSCHLDYLSKDEINGYIDHRLFIAGNQGQLRFSPQAVKLIHHQSGGVPRMINKICDLALTAAYASNSNIVEKRHLKAAAEELIELQGIANTVSTGKRFFKSNIWTTIMWVAAFMAAMIIGFAAHGYLSGPLSVTGALNNLAGSQPAGSQPVQTWKIVNSDPEQPIVAPTPRRLRAYILQLGSYSTLATAQRAVEIYSRKGIEAHWNKVQLGKRGTWYRVFTGRFASFESAQQYQNRVAVADARIIYAPWTVVLDQSGEKEAIASVKSSLRARGVDSYVVTTADGQSLLCSGAFTSQNRAESAAFQLNLHTGVVTRVVNFQMDLISGHQSRVAAAGDITP